MNKKISLGAAVSFMVVVVAITFCVTMVFSLNIFNSRIVNIKQKDDINNKITQLDQIVTQSYAGKVNSQKLVDSIAKGYINGIDDPFAVYYTPKDLNDYNQALKGVVMGIGVTTQKDDSGYLLVTKVYDNSPAFSAGILPGDLIVAIGSQDLKTLDYTASADMLKGEAGTTVKVTFRRGTQDTSVDIIRRTLDIPSVELKMLGFIAYMKISSFTNKTLDEFEAAYKNAQNAGAKSIIFDVRGNSSSELSPVINVLSRLLPPGNIGLERLKDGTAKPLGLVAAEEIKLPMAVIANAASAGSAEIFAMSLQEYNKAKVVGVTTMGKGVVQQIFNLKDGSAVKLTTSYILSASGQELNLVGIKPDYEVKLTAAQEKIAYALNETTDPQIKKAIEVLTTA